MQLPVIERLYQHIHDHALLACGSFGDLEERLAALNERLEALENGLGCGPENKASAEPNRKDKKQRQSPRLVSAAE